MQLEVRRAESAETVVVSAILCEAAEWTRHIGKPLWRPDETSIESVTDEVESGLFFLALIDGQARGTLRFQLSDPAVWPELTGEDSAFVHRLAVRRSVAGKGLSSLLLAWAADRTRSLRRRYLRLDCEMGRPRLRAFYEAHGFRHHSDAEIEPYHLSRFELDLLQGGSTMLARQAEQAATRSRLLK